ncbi:SDR family oxidoreductase [Brevirhabdus sp.]|uniref:SDR family oxidoreductase n=1 Tax=Brevirhabdus sp. TaxID=2004514 RepID=UPI0040582CEE
MTASSTVLLTGATGFIAKHIVIRLLDAGYHVVGTLRRPDRGEEVLHAVRPHVKDPDTLSDRLRFVVLDLTSDEGWAEAFGGVDMLIHSASPFPLDEPEDEQALIAPAVEGTLRALRHAHDNGIARVVLTSSVAAVAYGDLPEGKSVYDEEDWTDPASPAATAYVRSKTAAERAAWDFQRNEAPGMKLTTINPALVLGPPLDENYGSSIKVVERLLRGRDPMIPNFGFAVVDVRDVAEMHVRALSRPETAGRRILASSGFLWLADIAQMLRRKYPDRDIARRRAPDLLIRILGRFDKTLRGIVPMLGQRKEISNLRAQRELDMSFIPAEEAVMASADYMVTHHQV